MGLKSVTPGTMAMGVVLVSIPFSFCRSLSNNAEQASWAVSADSEFRSVGVTTRISWIKMFDEIKAAAEELETYKEGRQTIKLWNEFVFGNACDPEHDKDEDLYDNEFAQWAQEMDDKDDDEGQYLFILSQPHQMIQIPDYM